MKRKWILGIDPGSRGALALLSRDGAVRAVRDMPTILKGKRKKRLHVDAVALADMIRRAGDIDCAFLEQVHSMPRDGHVGAFRFGDSNGIVRGVLAALGIRVIEISPSVWKQAVRVQASDDARVRANELFTACSHHWPLHKHEGRAEAAMLALYGMRKHLGLGSIEW